MSFHKWMTNEVVDCLGFNWQIECFMGNCRRGEELVDF